MIRDSHTNKQKNHDMAKLDLCINIGSSLPGTEMELSTMAFSISVFDLSTHAHASKTRSV